MRRGRSFAVSLVGLTALFALLPAAALGAEVGFCLSGGLFSPGGSVYRDIYGGAMPVNAEATVGLGSGLELGLGLNIISDKGRAQLVEGEPGASYELKFTRCSLPLSLYFRFDAGPVVVRLGGGLAWVRFREAWLDPGLEELTVTGSVFSPRFSGTLDIGITRRLSGCFTVLYESVSTSASRVSLGSINLGGLQFLAGVRLTLGSNRAVGR